MSRVRPFAAVGALALSACVLSPLAALADDEMNPYVELAALKKAYKDEGNDPWDGETTCGKFASYTSPDGATGVIRDHGFFFMDENYMDFRNAKVEAGVFSVDVYACETPLMAAPVVWMDNDGTGDDRFTIPDYKIGDSTGELQYVVNGVVYEPGTHKVPQGWYGPNGKARLTIDARSTDPDRYPVSDERQHHWVATFTGGEKSAWDPQVELAKLKKAYAESGQEQWDGATRCTRAATFTSEDGADGVLDRYGDIFMDEDFMDFRNPRLNDEGEFVVDHFICETPVLAPNPTLFDDDGIQNDRITIPSYEIGTNGAEIQYLVNGEVWERGTRVIPASWYDKDGNAVVKVEARSTDEKNYPISPTSQTVWTQTFTGGPVTTEPTPDPTNPDPTNPDPTNPDPTNPDPADPGPANPGPTENPTTQPTDQGTPSNGSGSTSNGSGTSQTGSSTGTGTPAASGTPATSGTTAATAQGSTAQRLPRTGSDVALPALVALGMIVTGGVLVGAVRRRRAGR